MLPTPFLLSSQQRQIRSFTQDVIPYLHKIIFQITNPLPFEIKHSSQNNQLMFTQPRDPKNKAKPEYKDTALTVTEQITPSQLVSRNKEMMKINEKNTLNQNPLKSFLYRTF